MKKYVKKTFLKQRPEKDLEETTLRLNPMTSNFSCKKRKSWVTVLKKS